jgi:molybdenum cofactor biosynthesis enzyme
MCTPASKDITITGIRLMEKSDSRSNYLSAKDRTHERKS